MRNAIAASVDALIEDFPDSGVTDFVSSFAVPLPCGVIADQFGVPREDVPKLKLWSDALMDSFSMMMTPERELEVAELLLEFQQYFARAFEERIRAPADDMLSDLVRIEAGEQPMSMNELLDMMSQLLTGGNDTTTGALAEGALLLATYPEVQRRLRTEPELVDNFVEEVLRLESPVQGLMRVTTRDVELGGTMIPSGSVVIARYGSANRDESHFPNPDFFDADRAEAKEHLAFGMGPHFCPGAMLARAEMQIAFRNLLAQLGSIELAAPQPTLAHHRSLLHRRLKALPIRYQTL
ncbi:MAG: cytochrome P450 [Gammaproteobacteria bacterium]|nr:cytochrome P450 [Gammaproteobacteria bacterium]